MIEFEQDYYALLNIPPDADEREIKRAYRHLARRYHPDTTTEENPVERFREIQKAYECLIDPIQREAHDHWRQQQGLDRPLPLNVRVTPSQSNVLCLGESQVLYVLVEISASEEISGYRLPLNLCLVLDRSTSMKGARLQQVKVAARYIADQMGPNDVLSVVLFSDRAELILPGRRGIDKQAARAAINSVQSGGGTELLQGLTMGLKEVQRWQDKGMQNHLILLTDGQTYGDEDGCREMAKLAGRLNISLTLMGIGSDWNDNLLDEMARLSQGASSSIYIDSNTKIAKAFHDQVVSLGNACAHNLSLSVHHGEGVSTRDIFLVSPETTRLSLVDDRVLLGSLEKQQPRAVTLELLVGSHTPGVHRLLQVEVQGTVPSAGLQPLRTRQAVDVTFVTALGRQLPIPSDIVSAMGKVAIFKMQERAIEEIDMGQIEPAVSRLKTLATRLLDIGETELARAALLEAGRLAQTGSLSAEGRKKIRYGTRGLRILPKEVHYD
jgi:Ca-activated chloride channel family protein